jgi:protein TonB
LAIKKTGIIRQNNTIRVSILSEIKPKESTVPAPSPKLNNALKEKKYIATKQETSKNAIKEHLIAKTNPKPTEDKKPVVSSELSKTNDWTKQPTHSLSSTKNNFLARVKEAINANKHYPALAKNKEIEGKVHATFTINSDGSVSDIVIKEGNMILRDATRKAIERSFPVMVPSEIKNSMPTNEDITLNFNLIK